MATFEQHNIQLVGAGETIETEYDGKLRRLQKMFVCPYKDTVKCPRTDLFHEDNVFVPYPECDMMSPVIYKRNGQSVCAIVVDLNEPTLMETLNNIGDLIEFRNEKGGIKMVDCIYCNDKGVTKPTCGLYGGLCPGIIEACEGREPRTTVTDENYDVISKPSHYTEGRKYEPKDVIRDWDLNFNLGNTVKYVARAGRKDDVLQDLKKARQYLDFEIEYLEKEREEK